MLHPSIQTLGREGSLFLLLAPAPQIIQVFFHELLAFDLFFFAALSLRISLLKVSQESHHFFRGMGWIIKLSIIHLK